MEKIKLIDGKDPYSLETNLFSTDVLQYPKVGWGDIVYYLVFGHSVYTMTEFKMYKSLEAYNQFVCKWVKNVHVAHINERKLIVAEVLHSQRLSEKPLRPWIIVENNGTIQSAHCTCIAGLGESCSHVAAALFYVQDAVHNIEELSVTSTLPYWTSPSSQSVKFSEVENIDFSTPIQKKRCLSLKKATPVYVSARIVQDVTDEEFVKSLQKLKDINSKAAVLNVVKPFCEKKIVLPIELSVLFKTEYLSTELNVLQNIGMSTELAVTDEEVANLEKATVEQSRSTLWYRYRAGRITASNFKRVCSTQVENPSLSLIKSICYPQVMKFTTKAIQWGCTHENEARQQYASIKKQEHANFQVKKCGFLISTDHPHYGASPDGFVSCSCCGDGVLEIKCPFCFKDYSKEDLLERASCLEIDTKQLKTDHEYYFQIQLQLFVTKKLYCDFVLASEKSVYIQRIYPDYGFFNENIPLGNTFFKMVILPELLGRHFTHKTANVVEIESRKRPLIINNLFKK